MLWFFFASLTALFFSIRDVFNKTQLKEFDEYILAWSLTFFTAVGLSPLLFFIETPHIGKNFWIALLVSASLNAFSLTLYIRAIKSYDLSTVVPLTTFTPLFMLITSPLIVGEFPNFIGLIGMVTIVVGSYVLKIKEKEKGYLAPLRAIFTDPASKLVLFLASIWSISNNFDKMGILNSSAIFWAISVYLCISMLLLPVVIFKSIDNLPKFNLSWLKLVVYGFLNSIAIGSQMMAVSLTLVAYVISVKRTSALFSVLLGKIILKEQGIKEKLAGSVIMVFGVFLITISRGLEDNIIEVVSHFFGYNG